jgi:hypothetical protein
MLFGIFPFDPKTTDGPKGGVLRENVLIQINDHIKSAEPAGPSRITFLYGPFEKLNQFMTLQ